MRWRLFQLGYAVAALCIGAAGAVSAQSTLEYPIKATFLYKFGDFVSWPQQADVFVICIIGTDPFASVIDQITAGENVGGRPIAIRRMAAADGPGSCHVAYLGGLDARALPRALETLRNANTLTVTDEATNATAGMIHFVVRANRVRFIIDQEQAKQGGLGIPAALLAIAVPRR
jgi:hypothetical protein